MVTAEMLLQDVLPTQGRRLETTFDRIGYRIRGETPTAESMHRDESMAALDDDVVFGGWINLDETPQYFHGVPTTHRDVGNQKRGFGKITDEDEKAGYKARMQRIEIPSGHCIVFYERLVHEVVATRSTSCMVRLFLGWRVTDSSEPLFGTELTSKWIEDQAVPKIKSGQDPPVWPSAYSNFPRNFPTLTAWSERTFVPECLTTVTVGGKGAAAGTKWVRVPAKMKSLRALGLPMHPAYAPSEIALLAPSRSWELYTFDSQRKRVHIEGVRPDEWRAYKRARERNRASGRARRRWRTRRARA